MFYIFLCCTLVILQVGLFRMARLVRAALEFNTRRFRPRLIFAVFGRRLISPLHSFINLEVFEHSYVIIMLFSITYVQLAYSTHYCSAKNGTFGTLQMLLSQDVDVVFGPICSTGSYQYHTASNKLVTNDNNCHKIKKIILRFTISKK